jgi:hypothetical protein
MAQVRKLSFFGSSHFTMGILFAMIYLA